MSSIPAVDAVPQSPPQREDRANRAAVAFGAAESHRERVREKMRVDPAGVADRKHATERQSVRDERFELERQAYAQGQRTGFIVDVEA